MTARSTTTSIRAAVLDRPGIPVRIETLELDPPGPGEVRLRLLASGVPANVGDANGSTSLMLAVVNGHLQAARVLLDGGARVNAGNRGSITPVMLAVINEHPEVLKLLLERGADTEATSDHGFTP